MTRDILVMSQIHKLGTRIKLIERNSALSSLLSDLRLMLELEIELVKDEKVIVSPFYSAFDAKLTCPPDIKFPLLLLSLALNKQVFVVIEQNHSPDILVFDSAGVVLSQLLLKVVKFARARLMDEHVCRAPSFSGQLSESPFRKTLQITRAIYSNPKLSYNDGQQREQWLRENASDILTGFNSLQLASDAQLAPALLRGSCLLKAPSQPQVAEECFTITDWTTYKSQTCDLARATSNKSNEAARWFYERLNAHKVARCDASMRNCTTLAVNLCAWSASNSITGTPDHCKKLTSFHEINSTNNNNNNNNCAHYDNHCGLNGEEQLLIGAKLIGQQTIERVRKQSSHDQISSRQFSLSSSFKLTCDCLQVARTNYQSKLLTLTLTSATLLPSMLYAIIINLTLASENSYWALNCWLQAGFNLSKEFKLGHGQRKACKFRQKPWSLLKLTLLLLASCCLLVHSQFRGEPTKISNSSQSVKLGGFLVLVAEASELGAGKPLGQASTSVDTNTNTNTTSPMTDDLMLMLMQANHHKLSSIPPIPWRQLANNETHNRRQPASLFGWPSKLAKRMGSASENKNQPETKTSTTTPSVLWTTQSSSAATADLDFRFGNGQFWSDVGGIMARVVANQLAAGGRDYFTKRNSHGNRYANRWTQISAPDNNNNNLAASFGRPQSGPAPASVHLESQHALPHLPSSSPSPLSSTIMAFLGSQLPNLNTNRFFPPPDRQSSNGGSGTNGDNDRRRQDSFFLRRRQSSLIRRALNRISDRIGARNSIRVHNAFRDFAWRLLGSLSMPTPIIYELRRQNFYSPLDDIANDDLYNKNTSKTIRIGRKLNGFLESLAGSLSATVQSGLITNTTTKISRLRRSLGQHKLERQFVEQPDLNFNNGPRERFRARIEDLIRISRNRPLFGRVIRMPSLFPFRRRREEMPSYQSASQKDKQKQQQQVASINSDKTKTTMNGNDDGNRNKLPLDDSIQLKPTMINHPIGMIQLLPPTASLIENNKAYADTITKTTIQQHKITRKTVNPDPNASSNNIRRLHKIRLFSRRKDNKTKKTKDPSEDHQIINIDGKKFYLDDENELKPLN